MRGRKSTFLPREETTIHTTVCKLLFESSRISELDETRTSVPDGGEELIDDLSNYSILMKERNSVND